LQRGDQPLGEITLAAGINPGDRRQNAPLGGNRSSGGQDLIDQAL